jgi:hypothetical protein
MTSKLAATPEVLPMSRPRSSKPSGSAATLLRLALAVLAATALAAAWPARARAGTDCDTSEQVACIPLPSDTSTATGSPQPGAAPSGPVAAAAAAPIFCAPPGCCGVPPGGPLTPDQTAAAPLPCRPPANPCYPYVAAAPAAPSTGASAAVPVPVPPTGCNPYRSIYSTINLGNAADVRALRTASTDGLSRYWRQDALDQIQAQVSYLQSVGDYANARLYSIQVQSATLDLLSSTARVRTLEHWLYQERSSFDGSLVYSQDEWVTNNYVLSSIGSGWYITSDTISAAPPIAVPAGG